MRSGDAAPGDGAGVGHRFDVDSTPHGPETASPARRIRALLAVLVAAGALLLATAAPAAAHASLLSVDPPDGSRLDASPGTVTLTFSEHVSVDLGGVRVIGPGGARVEEGAATARGSTVSVGVPADLADGTYVISYRVVSADGHPVRGGSVFGIGDGTVDTGALGRVSAGSDDRRWEVVGGIGRGLAYAGVLVAAGGALFLVHAHRGDRRSREWRRLARLVRAAALVGGLAALVALPVQAALGTGQGALSLFDDGVLGDVAADGVGLSLVLGLVGLLLVAGALGRSAPLAVAGATLAAASFAATGHTRAGELAGLATVTDVAHLLAAAVWAGGLVLLWATLRLRRHLLGAPARDGGRDTAATEPGTAPAEPSDKTQLVATAGIVARFSQLATTAIAVVGLAGLVLGWREVRSFGALTDTGYGLFLVAKVAVVGAIAAIGTYNHYRLVPAISAGKARAGLARLRLTLRLEAVGLVAVAALTAVLVVLTPARAELEGGVEEEIVELGDAGSVQVVVAPARAGVNQIHIYTYDADGRPAETAQEITMELSLPAVGLGPIERTPQRAGPAHFQLDGGDLAVAGEWEILVRVRLDRFDEATGTATVTIR